jgi:hypothetical protein
MNNNHYGFTPQRSTKDAAIAVKDFVEEGLWVGEFVVLVSLHVRGVFDAVWWTSMLNGLKVCDYLKNLYNLTKVTLASDPLSCQLTAFERREK